ncbi:hypothetical protein [Streptomyces sp. NPDC101165]|uniref:hypothetical protein n=1 Tax=Streptomyces sp. NPDC101165 TaxID=3366119 RepID=UPI003818330F
MTTADHRPDGAHGAALQWTRAAVIALMAALVVLVHHETPAAITHLSPARAMAGMGHTARPTLSVHASDHAMPSLATGPTAIHDDAGACSGTVMQHCAVAGVDGTKLVPPHHASTGCAPAAPAGTAAGRDVPGTTGRAPPDLSVLSRLLL